MNIRERISTVTDSTSASVGSALGACPTLPFGHSSRVNVGQAPLWESQAPEPGT